MIFGDDQNGIVLKLKSGYNAITDHDTMYYEIVASSGSIEVDSSKQYHLYAVSDSARIQNSGIKMVDMPYSFSGYKFIPESPGVCILFDFSYDDKAGFVTTNNYFVPRDRENNDAIAIFNDTLLVLEANTFQFMGTMCNHSGNYDPHAILLTPIS